MANHHPSALLSIRHRTCTLVFERVLHSWISNLCEFNFFAQEQARWYWPASSVNSIPVVSSLRLSTDLEQGFLNTFLKNQKWREGVCLLILIIEEEVLACRWPTHPPTCMWPWASPTHPRSSGQQSHLAVSPVQLSLYHQFWLGLY